MLVSAEARLEALRRELKTQEKEAHKLELAATRQKHRIEMLLTEKKQALAKAREATTKSDKYAEQIAGYREQLTTQKTLITTMTERMGALEQDWRSMRTAGPENPTPNPDNADTVNALRQELKVLRKTAESEKAERTKMKGELEALQRISLVTPEMLGEVNRNILNLHTQSGSVGLGESERAVHQAQLATLEAQKTQIQADLQSKLADAATQLQLTNLNNETLFKNMEAGQKNLQSALITMGTAVGLQREQVIQAYEGGQETMRQVVSHSLGTLIQKQIEPLQLQIANIDTSKPEKFVELEAEISGLRKLVHTTQVNTTAAELAQKQLLAIETVGEKLIEKMNKVEKESVEMKSQISTLLPTDPVLLQLADSYTETQQQQALLTRNYKDLASLGVANQIVLHQAETYTDPESFQLALEAGVSVPEITAVEDLSQSLVLYNNSESLPPPYEENSPIYNKVLPEVAGWMVLRQDFTTGNGLLYNLSHIKTIPENLDLFQKTWQAVHARIDAAFEPFRDKDSLTSLNLNPKAMQVEYEYMLDFMQLLQTKFFTRSAINKNKKRSRLPSLLDAYSNGEEESAAKKPKRDYGMTEDEILEADLAAELDMQEEVLTSQPLDAFSLRLKQAAGAPPSKEEEQTEMLEILHSMLVEHRDATTPPPTRNIQEEEPIDMNSSNNVEEFKEQLENEFGGKYETFNPNKDYNWDEWIAKQAAHLEMEEQAAQREIDVFKRALEEGNFEKAITAEKVIGPNASRYGPEERNKHAEYHVTPDSYVYEIPNAEKTDRTTVVVPRRQLPPHKVHEVPEFTQSPPPVTGATRTSSRRKSMPRKAQIREMDRYIGGKGKQVQMPGGQLMVFDDVEAADEARHLIKAAYKEAKLATHSRKKAEKYVQGSKVQNVVSRQRRDRLANIEIK
jgi:hypothetical protein